MSNGIFTISLDFELHWGGFEKWPLKTHKNKPQADRTYYNEYFLKTRKAIPEMLRLFQNYEIHVTWATVGLLFHQSKEELLQNRPKQKPSYKNLNLSAYQYIAHVGIGDNENEDPFHYAPSLIKKIISTPHQELGTHTYSHYYCNEEGQNTDQFREDIRAAKQIAKNYTINLKSLVFPRNQFNRHYLQICFQEDIQAVRSNPADWFWNIESTQHESYWKRFNRGLDAYFPIGKKNTYSLRSLRREKNLPVCIPASRLLRPYNPKELFLNNFKIKRIKNEMTHAAREGELYHLWWHPHNFGNYPKESLNALEQILQHYQYCRDRWKMKSLNMGEISSLISI